MTEKWVVDPSSVKDFIRQLLASKKAAIEGKILKEGIVSSGLSAAIEILEG